MSAVAVSVVLPAYNEAQTLEHTVRRTIEQLEAFLPADTFEIIIAEDGSTDNTPEIAAGLARDDDRIRHFHSDERQGRGQALERAFSAADGQTLAYFDTDLATDLRHLEELITSVKDGEADIATGSRLIPGNQIDRPAKRGIPSRVFNWLARAVLRSRLRDHQCGFKAIDRDLFLALKDSIEDNHWFWDTELLVRAQRAGYTIHEFPVDWTPEDDTKVDLVRDVFGMGSQLVRTWYQLSVEPRVTRRRSIAAGVLLTAFAVVLMTVYLDFSAVIQQMRTALQRQPLLLAIAPVVYLLSWPLRGRRYQDILAELGYREELWFLTGAIFISQTGNLVFPARAGDAIRAYVVKTRRAVPYPSGFASLAIERVFDLLTITALAGSVLLGLVVTGISLTLPEATGGGYAQSGRTALVVAGGVGLAAIITVVAIVLSARSDRNYVRSIVGRISEDSYAGYVVGVVESFVGDVQTVATDARVFTSIGFSSILIWTLDVLTAVLVFAAFEPGISLNALIVVSFFAVSVGNLAKVLPLSPGGIGLYEGAFTLIVVGATGLPWQLALGAAFVDHAIKNAVTVAGGIVSMLVLNVSLTTAVEEGREPSPADTDRPDQSRS